MTRPRSRVRRVRRAVDTSVAALRRAGRLEAVDEALVALARTLADEVDDEHASPECSRYVVGTLAGRLVVVLDELRHAGGEVGKGIDEFDAAFARLSAEIRDGPQP